MMILEMILWRIYRYLIMEDIWRDDGGLWRDDIMRIYGEMILWRIYGEMILWRIYGEMILWRIYGR